MADTPVILWFRQDLRLADNPALNHAADTGRPVIPLYVLEDESHWGAASLWWLHNSLDSLSKSLRGLDSRLILRRGDAGRIIADLARKTGAGAVYWNRRYDGGGIAHDTAIKESLQRVGIAADSFNAGLLYEPWTIRNKQGHPYKVFGQYWRACQDAGDPPRPAPGPKQLRVPSHWPASDDLKDWALLPTRPDWAGGLRETWAPGEDGAQERLGDFIEDRLKSYAAHRDLAAKDSTSMLSPYLHWGEISPRQLWHAVRGAGHHHRGLDADVGKFLSELGWREFSHHLLFAYPDLRTEPIRPEFADFPWEYNRKALKAWQRGRTGYPMVDAGMRQLWHTGWMHNRVRMIVASFLVKHLLLPWQWGEAWFWDCLVDADAANNAASWQWVAGCGADAAPYFRIFNPVIQGRKFDPKGDYVRQWVPELRDVPVARLHEPSDKVVSYPSPIIAHDAARRRALAAFASLKKGPKAQ